MTYLPVPYLVSFTARTACMKAHSELLLCAKL